MTPEEILSHPASILTEEQRAAFFEDGYLCFEGLIAGAALTSIQAAMADLVEESRALTTETSLEFMLAPGHSAAVPRLIQLRRVVETHPGFWNFASRGTLVDVAVRHNRRAGGQPVLGATSSAPTCAFAAARPTSIANGRASAGR